MPLTRDPGAIAIVAIAFALGCVVTWGVMHPRLPEVGNPTLSLAMGRVSVNHFVVMSKLMAEEKRFDEAVAIASRGLELFPGHAALRNNLGYAQLMSGRIGEAQATLASLAADQPENTLAKGNLAAALSERRVIEAKIEALENELVNPAPGQTPRIRRQIGYWHLRLDQPADALRLLEPLVEPDSTDHEAVNLAGVALMRQRKPDEARTYFRRALEFQPDNANYQANARWAQEESR